MRIFLMFIFLLFTANAQGAMCVKDNVGRCEALGYTEANCAYGGIACPFDTSLWHCAEWSCEDGRYKNIKDEKPGITCKEITYKGKTCFDCACEAEASCIWNSLNSGHSELSDKCCNNFYKTCRSTCADTVIPPLNSEGIKEYCSGCGKTVEITTGFKCKKCYVQSGNSCSAQSCPSGYNVKYQSVNDCGSSGSDGWIFEENGCSGEKLCGKCSAKTCPEGSIDNDSISCGDDKYWDKEFSGNYAGDNKCYNACTCKAPAACKWETGTEGTATLSNKCCNGKYETCTSQCKDQVIIPAHGLPITSPCTACGTTIDIITDFSCENGYTKQGKECVQSGCQSGFDTKYQSVNDCGSSGSDGWSYTTGGMSGDKACGKCTAKTCSSGSTESDISHCGSGKYWFKDFNNGYAGDAKCYNDCVCRAEAGCTWSDANKGTAALTNLCCNGKYETCTSSCVEVTVPANAQATSTCTGCGKTVNTAWACKTGYTQSGNTCIISTCNAGCATAVSGCGSAGDKGWTLGANCNMSGTSQCKTCTKKACTSGNTDQGVSSCGYPSTKYASKVLNGSYNGNDACYDCKCESPAACKWDNSNKGTANLTNQCCNGKYETCTSTCVEVTVPANAHATATCTGCSATVNTAWECNEGYNRSGNICVVGTCNAGCAIATTGCGSSGDKGWTLGANCNISGGSQCKTCTAKTCTSGDSDSTVSSCGYPAVKYASKPANGSYNGDSACYDCKCEAPAACKWEDSNKGTAGISNQCCNGKYETCTSSCVAVTIPANAHATTTCTGCGTTVNTAWECNTGYTKNGETCKISICPVNSATAASDCGSSGAKGWKLGTTSTGSSGSSKCYSCQALACSSGNTDNSVSSCGYSSTRYAAKAANGFYNGDSACYDCKCEAPAACKWDSSNKGTGNITNQCCDGKYETCTSSCVAVTIPANAHATTTCTGCGTTVNTAWECNTGYTKNGETCKISTCPANSATTASDCGSSGAKGWKLGTTSTGSSGSSKCYSCQALSCTSGNTDNSVSSCGYSSTRYAAKAANGSYNGDSACYDCKCEAPAACKWDTSNKGSSTLTNQCCNGKYETCTSSCVAVTIPANAHATTTCTGCGITVNTAWECNTGYTKSGNSCVIATCNSGCATNADGCGSSGDKGWTLGTNCNMSGGTQCKTCTKKSCTTGDTNNAVTTCGYPATKYASKSANGYYNGDSACYTCKCEAPSSCKWTSANKGTANLSNQCCNGNYETCTSTCTAVTVPANATATATCTGCGTTVNTAWECNTGYTKSGNSCIISTCPAGSATTVSGCGSSGSSGWTLGSANGSYSGSSPCKTCSAKYCPPHTSTSNNPSFCGYPSTRYATLNSTGSYNGDAVCYICDCLAPAACKWTDANKGTANISSQCCNGNYETCTSTCTAVTVPSNAHATSTCTGCGITVNTAWACNDGYVKSGNSCVVATCDTGCSTSTSGCGSTGDKGWTLGSNCNKSGVEQCKTCTKKACPTGSDTTSAASSCGYVATKYAAKTATGSYSGDSPCYTCKCEAPASCKWTDANKGTANISSQCCNGNYETCTSTCTAVTIPSNAHATSTCTGCGTTVGTAWACNTGFWNYSTTCSAQSSNICATLGYKSSSCSGDWVACPYNASAKKCL